MIPEYTAGFLGNLLKNAKIPGPPEDDDYEATTVFLLIFIKNGAPYLLAVLKADNIGYPWRNQVALPGGHVDNNDKNALEAAYRELEEEVGISRDQVQYVGSMGHFQTIAQKDIEVFIGMWDAGSANLKYDPREISRILEIPLCDLLQMHVSNHYHKRKPDITELIYCIDDIIIWGVTARIFHSFFELIIGNKDWPSSMDLNMSTEKK